MSGQDPFAGLLLEMQGQARQVQPPGWCLGKVMDIGPGRLLIRADGHDLDQEDLWIDPRLLAGHEEPIKIKFIPPEDGAAATLDIGGAWIQCYIPIDDSAIESMCLYELPGLLTQEIQGSMTLLANRIKPGDWVVLLPDTTGEYYYVLSKVVRPGDIISAD